MQPGHPAATVQEREWGRTPQGEPVTLFTLRVPGGLEARLSNYGAVLVGLLTPDRDGRLSDIVLGYDAPEPYFDRATAAFFGATVGRYANRIAGGRFSLDGRTYQLARNDGQGTLHGGERGFDQQLWWGEGSVSAEGPRVTFTRVSPDGEEGYPGTLRVRVTYTLRPAGALQLDYEAETDAPTVLNLTHHSYWNLSGDARRDILAHELTLAADEFTPVGETLLPTGERRAVAGTPFDFREAHPIGARIDTPDEQLRFAGGYDHNFILRDGSAPAALLSDPGSGRWLAVFTDQPGLQVYSGNFLDGSLVGKGGQRYGHRWAVCLETQHFPDSPNQPAFPSTVLRPGEHFRSRTVYRFWSG
ncbi:MULTISPECIES: aldose epimerase family protein [Deinococcus]|uniref:aldose epimerase family protein n=1 Tax=Deinococcus TaxID=1298 RepID=UPI0004836D6F|nr:MULTISPECIES: aldose epimerase family protein [Deinococcus]KEF35190.1 aldose epimerase [Deinococcus sp. RL]